MKKFLIFLPTLALIGAGCAGSTNVETKSDTSTQPESSGSVVEQVPDGQKKSDTSKAKTNEAGEQIIVSDGAEIVVQPSPDKKTNTEDDNVPITDVILGGEKQKIDMIVRNFSFEPKTITAAPGDKIKITFTKNVGFHTFVIDELNLKQAIKQGESLIFTVPSKAGSYPFYCDVGSHRANGMEGTLIVK
jgi:plastocyanin